MIPIHYPLDCLAVAFPFPGNARNQKKTKHLKIIYRFSIKFAQESNGSCRQTADIPTNSPSALPLQNRRPARRNPLTNSFSPLTEGTENVTTKTELGRQLAFGGIHLFSFLG